MSKFSLEGLRKFDDRDFNVKELFLLHQRSTVLARCKVQAHETDYAVILVIGGEYERITRCITEREVWSVAAAWKAELLAQRWHPVDPPASTVWRSRHDEWTLSVVNAPNAYDRTDSGYYSGIVWRDGALAFIGEPFAEPTVHLAQMEILRQLVDQTGHVCSGECTPWTFELRARDSDMEPPS
jgi:hypothetical protein